MEIYLAPIGRAEGRIISGIQTFKPQMTYLFLDKSGEYKEITKKSAQNIRAKLKSYYVFAEDTPIDFNNVEEICNILSKIISRHTEKNSTINIILDISGLPRDLAIELSSFLTTQFSNIKTVFTQSSRTIEDLEGALPLITEDEGKKPRIIHTYKKEIKDIIVPLTTDTNSEKEKKSEYKDILLKIYEFSKTGISRSKLEEELEIPGKSRPARLRKIQRIADELEKCKCIYSYLEKGERFHNITETGKKIIEIFELSKTQDNNV